MKDSSNIIAEIQRDKNSQFIAHKSSIFEGFYFVSNENSEFVYLVYSYTLVFNFLNAAGSINVYKHQFYTWQWYHYCVWFMWPSGSELWITRQSDKSTSQSTLMSMLLVSVICSPNIHPAYCNSKPFVSFILLFLLCKHEENLKLCRGICQVRSTILASHPDTDWDRTTKRDGKS